MKAGSAMKIGKAVEQLEQRLVEDINQSGLHPVVVRLVLLNLLHVVEEQQKELERGEQTADG